ncbi:hypothetical protein OFAG_02290 [Oxalobacter formigenes HOxBLS]|uniref:Uncharacterized protein n=1 Tax=Oxalobacter paraformigenes TaxID=556268 RepID=T5LT15_9BURK|nr:hypothetical protein OFAG_02290 [Oxalobacter paraformigenes]
MKKERPDPYRKDRILALFRAPVKLFSQGFVIAILDQGVCPGAGGPVFATALR